MSDPPNVGASPPPEAMRDAIHVAVAPVVAGEELAPGARVGRGADGTFTRRARPPVGLVDPYLERAVNRGERFWLFLFPNTVTSLRHCWTHPAFRVRPPGRGP